MQRLFGTGNMYALPVGGGAPIVLGSINSASVDFSADKKELFGQNQYPDAVAIGKRKITGKCSVGLIDLNLANALFFGQSVATGQTLTALSEAGVIGSSPYTYTAANAATFKTDLGVYYASTGAQLLQVPSAPTTGQYTVNATTGVYTFASGDAGKAITVVYDYGVTGSGYNMTVTQQLMGVTPTFQLSLRNVYQGKEFGFDLLSCVCDKFSMPFKQDDFLLQEFDFSAFANAAGQVYRPFNG